LGDATLLKACGAAPLAMGAARAAGCHRLSSCRRSTTLLRAPSRSGNAARDQPSRLQGRRSVPRSEGKPSRHKQALPPEGRDQRRGDDGEQPPGGQHRGPVRQHRQGLRANVPGRQSLRCELSGEQGRKSPLAPESVAPGPVGACRVDLAPAGMSLFPYCWCGWPWTKTRRPSKTSFPAVWGSWSRRRHVHSGLCPPWRSPRS
jgi:hypothetical protein